MHNHSIFAVLLFSVVFTTVSAWVNPVLTIVFLAVFGVAFAVEIIRK